MTSLMVAFGLLLGLFLSTLAWAMARVKVMAQGEGPHDLMTARLWAAAIPLGLLLLLLLAAALALMTAGETVLVRITAALSTRVVMSGLVVCALAGLYPAVLCVRLWRAHGHPLAERLHLGLHVTVTYVVIVLLLLETG